MKTFPEYIKQWAEECPEKPAIIYDGSTTCYRELYDKIVAGESLPIPLLGESWKGPFCLYTTGTTGQSKGVVVSQEAVIANSENLIEAQGFCHDTVFVIAGNMEHLGCWSKIFPTLMMGGTLIILKDQMKDLDAFFRAFDGKERVFATFLVPSNIRILLQFASDRLAALADRMDFLETGAAPMLQADMEKLCRLLPHTRLYNTYASTETGIVATYNYNPTSSPLRGGQVGSTEAGCLGPALKNSEIFITPEGHIACKGKTLMTGYKDDPELTGRVLRDGTLYTSDNGCLDDNGYLHILGRDDDTINVGGYKVAPSEVESVVMELPEIADCICVSQPHPVLGHAPSLLVVMKDNISLDKRRVAQYIASKLDRYKVPLTYKVVENIKRNVNGKLDRKFYRI